MVTIFKGTAGRGQALLPISNTAKQGLGRQTRRRVAARALARGVTLVEVLIVVAIMAVIAGGATMLVFPALKKSRIKACQLEAEQIKTAARLHQELDGSECPTVQDLVNNKSIDGEKAADPWGSTYKIKCDGSEMQVISPGADKKDGTPDDVRDNFPIKQSDVDKIANL
jgi:general secretion pathway protein G